MIKGKSLPSSEKPFREVFFSGVKLNSLLFLLKMKSILATTFIQAFRYLQHGAGWHPAGQRPALGGGAGKRGRSPNGAMEGAGRLNEWSMRFSNAIKELCLLWCCNGNPVLLRYIHSEVLNLRQKFSKKAKLVRVR